MKDADILRSSCRPKRQDGETTRQSLLQAAGQIFAQKGYANATSKEICAQAGANVAAVNYYFGGKDKLYEEVLVEGHKQIISLDDLHDILDGSGADEEKLCKLLTRLVHTAADSSSLWGIRLFMRELAAPSPFVPSVLRQAVLPKAAMVRTLMARILKLPAEHPAVQRALVLCILPCLSLILFLETLRTQVLPATAANAEGLLDDIHCYVQAGLAALALRHGQEPRLSS